MTKSLLPYLFLALGLCCGTCGRAQIYDVRDFGATGRGDDTEAIQRAIDVVSQNGGTLLFPADTFSTGMIELRSNMEIKLQAGAVWRAIPDLVRYPEMSFSTADLSQKDGFTMTRRAFILGRSIHHFSLTGPGKIYPSGDRHDAFPDHESNGAKRPYGLYFIDSYHLRITDLELENSAFWMLRLYRCDDVTLRGIRLWNHANTNNDGIDLVDCHRVTVSDCVIDSSDDALCLKSEAPRGCRDIVITNCIVSSTASYIKLGTAGFGAFERIAVSNCVLRTTRAEEIIHGLQIPQGITGLAMMSPDGATMRHISFDNIVMEGLSCPIFVRLSNRFRVTHAEYANHPMTPGVVEDISFSNIRAYGVGALPVVISGYPGHPVRRVRLNDVIIHGGRPGTLTDKELKYPDNDGGYPSPLMFGTDLPAYGAFLRYAEDVRFDDVAFVPAAGEVRAPVVTLGSKHTVLREVYADGKLLRQRDLRKK
ncbi:MAG: glycosyl hydrolase family 28 protein [Bacteroidota bacterium]